LSAGAALGGDAFSAAAVDCGGSAGKGAERETRVTPAAFRLASCCAAARRGAELFAIYVDILPIGVAIGCSRF
jgi:hypothetical protein